MVAVLVLTPEERGIVLDGGLPEPRYRPFPGGSNDREEDDYPDPDFDHGGDDSDPWDTSGNHDDLGLPDDEPFKARTLVEATIEAAESGTPAGQDEQPYLRPANDVRFERQAAAQHWRRSSSEIALLFARVPAAVKELSPDAGEFEMIGLARAAAGPRGRDGGVRRLAIGPCCAMSGGLSSASIKGLLPPRLQCIFDRILNEPARPFPPATGDAVSTAVADLVAGYADAIRELWPQPRQRRRFADPTLERRDAFATALRMFAGRWRDLRPHVEAQVTSFAHEIDSSMPATENDAISDDASNFPGWNRSSRSQRGWWEFRNNGRRLLLKNINVSTQETRTGADLVYARRAPDSFVLVQYKMLEQLDGEWVYRPRSDDRLYRQLDRLLSYLESPMPLVAPARIEDHRLGPGFTFVKFLEGYPQRGLADDELTSGFYLPAALVKEMLKTPDSGPRGGKVHYVSKGRYIDTRTFVKLVQDAWIGSVGSTEALIRIVGLLPSTDVRERIVAIDEPINA